MPRTENFSTITLDELNAEAGLLTRMDRKYLVPPDDAQEVIDALAPRARVLQIDGLRDFRYASTYFDTPALDAFFLAARKRRRRYKIRTRTYLDSGLCFLEVKTNGSREATVKDRFKYDPDDADRITPRRPPIRHRAPGGVLHLLPGRGEHHRPGPRAGHGLHLQPHHPAPAP